MASSKVKLEDMVVFTFTYSPGNNVGTVRNEAVIETEEDRMVSTLTHPSGDRTACGLVKGSC